MDDVFVYYGPKNGFDQLVKNQNIQEEDLTDFSTLVRKSDERNREQYHLVQGSDAEIPKREPIHVKNLVIASDEYASVREHVILNFDGYISEFRINNLFLHNPPELILTKVQKTFSCITIHKYDYPKITIEMLKDFDNKYSKNIIGQESVKSNLLIAIYPLLRKKFLKPIVVLFYGPSGVGKTETAKYLSKLLGGELFRKQLSMFQNNEFMTYLFGGHHYDKSFAKDILERETNVILLDEFDKANSVFHSAFYQLFDEGIFIDKNYHAEIGKSIIICTSNYNSLAEIRKQLGDPIFSRFDACIKFNELKSVDIQKIIELRINQEYELLDEDEKVKINKMEIIDMFSNHISNITNARRIESIVREVISEKLLNDALK